MLENSEPDAKILMFFVSQNHRETLMLQDLETWSDEKLKTMASEIHKEMERRMQIKQAARAVHLIEIEETNKTPICVSKTCWLNKECANHETAGDFRSEAGFTPNLQKKDNVWYCEQKETGSRGMLIWKDGKYSPYSLRD